MGWAYVMTAVAVVFAGLALLALASVRLRLRSIRRSVELALAADGPDEEIRVSQGNGRGECGLLARRVDELLGAARASCRRNMQQHVENEATWRGRYVRQQLGERYVARQSNSIIAESTELTKFGLSNILDNTTAALAATSVIEGAIKTAMATLGSAVRANDETVSILNSLRERIQRVEGITAFISTVADQTHLLALNAAMEAARAGHAGKGFGVVAQEIKSLAGETSHSAAEIGKTIASLRNVAAEVATSVSGVTGHINESSATSQSANAAIEDQQQTLQDLEMCVQDLTAQMDLLVSMASDIDRRRHPRVSMSGSVRVSTPTNSYPGDLLDMSEGGLQCAVEKAAEAAVSDKIKIYFGDDTDQQYLDAIVMWRHNDEKRDRIGVEFREMTPAQEELVVELMAGLLPEVDA